MGATLVDAAAGFLFWVLATRIVDPSVVGVASALLGVITIIAIASTLGMDWNLLDLLPVEDSRPRRVVIAVAALRRAAMAAVASGVVLWWVLPRLSPEFGDQRSALLAVLVVTAVTAMTLGLVSDGLLLGIGRPDATFVRRISTAAAKILGLLFVAAFGLVSLTTIIASWVVAVGAVLLVGSVLVRRRLQNVLRSNVEPGVNVPDGFATRGTFHHISNLAGQLPNLLLPVMVLRELGAEQSAYIYTAWMLGSGLFMVSSAVGKSLLAERSTKHEGADLARMRSAVGLSAFLFIAASAGLLVVGPYVLAMFGSQYRAAGTPVLALVVVAAVPDSITNLWTARWQVQQRIGQTAILNSLIAASTLLALWQLLPVVGIQAAGWAWVIGQSLGIIYAIGLEATNSDRTSVEPVAQVQVNPKPALLIGAHKAGTTSAYETLGLHPQIHGPEEKEPGYFSIEDGGSLRHWLKYQRRLSTISPDARVWLDGSTSYACTNWHPDCSSRVVEALGDDIRVIYLVRDPLKRINSGWAQLCYEGIHKISDDPSASIDRLVEPTLYKTHYDAWVDAVGEDRVLVQTFEDMLAEPDDAWAAWLKHLEVDEYPTPQLAHSNRSDDHQQLPPLIAKLVGAGALSRLRHHEALAPVGQMLRRRGNHVQKPSLDAGALGDRWAEVEQEAQEILRIAGRPSSVWPSLNATTSADNGPMREMLSV